jgi:glycosyltransferase involved in cell wall biosynthesis
MSRTIAIVTPAFRAEATIAETVRSVIGQTWTDWELWLVADDGLDYEGLLGRAGIADPRIRYRSSGGVAQGASRARNMALEAVSTPYVAVLDADDRFKRDKLERVVAGLETHAVVTTAIEVITESYRHLRHVGQGPDREMTPGAHKWVSLSMDSMIAWDRRRTDGRFDPSIRNMTDLEFLLQLFRGVPRSLHLGTPLHDYVKRPQSMSNGADVTAGMISSKTELLRRLQSGYYGLADEDIAGLVDFLELSLAAEREYDAALAARPGLLFEDHLEPRLREHDRVESST